MLAIFLFGIASVCASDVGDALIADEDSNQMDLSSNNEITEDNLQISEENTILTQINDDETVSEGTDCEILSASEGNYTELRTDIENGGNLTKSYYCYREGDGETIEITTPNMVINGNGAIIDMMESNIRALKVSAYNVTIKNLTIKNANYTSEGGAIYFSSSGTLLNCTFTNNKATAKYSYGGAVFFDGEGEVTNCNFTNNSAGYGGAIRISSGTVTNCNFINNTASYLGGAIDIGLSTTVKNCNFTNNKVTGDYGEGGAIYIYSGTVTNCNFTNNKVTGDYGEGGAIWMYSGNVTNCNFTNNSAMYGGAVYFGYEPAGTVENCNFVNNKAVGDNSCGGAIYFRYGGNVTNCNCNFINNSANYGGAVYFEDGFTIASVENCNFTNNSASYSGGAILICWGAVENCNFTNNKATAADSYGGAISMAFGNVTNCNFTNNNATNGFGGAVSFDEEGEVINCNFINNVASDGFGGAVYSKGNCNATNCKFINNNAKSGGATYNITANYCNFTKNAATEYGGAMYEGTNNDCIFKDNKAGISGDDIYNNTSPKSILSVSNFTSTYNSGDKLLFNFTSASGTPINDANITIKVYKNNALIGTYYALSGEGWVVKLDAGSYIAVCSLENQTFEVEPANATLSIDKQATKITAGEVTTIYNVNKNLIVTLKDGKGNALSGVSVTINLNGDKTYTTDKNGQIEVNVANLVPKTYTAKITFSGNSNYGASSEDVKVTVSKAKAIITAKKKTFKKAIKVKKYSITLKSGKTPINKAKVTIKIKNKTFKATTNAKGKATFKIKKLTKKGTFKATITYKGNAYYNKVTKTVKIKIK